MDSEETKILTVFKSQLVKFVQDLCTQFPSEGDFLALKFFIEQQIPVKDLMYGWIKQVNKKDKKVKIMIRERNDIFFIENNPFRFMTEKRLEKFSGMWMSQSEESKKIIWDWMDLFIKISDKFETINTV